MAISDKKHPLQNCFNEKQIFSIKDLVLLSLYIYQGPFIKYIKQKFGISGPAYDCATMRFERTTYPLDLEITADVFGPVYDDNYMHTLKFNVAIHRTKLWDLSFDATITKWNQHFNFLNERFFFQK